MVRYIAISAVFLYCGISLAEDCVPGLIEMTDKHLSCLGNKPVSNSLALGLKQQISRRKNCPKCKRSILGGESYSEIFVQKHMPIAVSSNPFGGNNLFVIFRDSTLLYKFWLYEIEKNNFQIREVSAESPTPDIAETIKKLKGQNKFWKM